MTDLMAEFTNLEESTIIVEAQSPPGVISSRLVRFVDWKERSEDTLFLEEALYRLFDPLRKKRYSMRLCTAIELPSG